MTRHLLITVSAPVLCRTCRLSECNSGEKLTSVMRTAFDPGTLRQVTSLSWDTPSTLLHITVQKLLRLRVRSGSDTAPDYAYGADGLCRTNVRALTATDQ